MSNKVPWGEYDKMITAKIDNRKDLANRNLCSEKIDIIEVYFLGKPEPVLFVEGVRIEDWLKRTSMNQPIETIEMDTKEDHIKKLTRMGFTKNQIKKMIGDLYE